MPVTADSVALIDWLNLSIKLKAHGREFGPSVARLLIEIARRESESYGYDLSRVHFVSESFGVEVLRVVDTNLSAIAHKTRTAKEQADLKLAVLAMDHLHQTGGTPGLFIIATGDQDFVPLIERILAEKAQVVLIAGSLSDLANEYRTIVSEQHVKLIGLMDHENVPMLTISRTGNDRALAIAGLLRLQMEGGVLGGDQTRNVARIAAWRLGGGKGSGEERLQAWIRQFCASEMRHVAVPGNAPTGNRADSRRRVFLDMGHGDVRLQVEDFDWILRRCDPRFGRQTRGTLGVGRFADDNGSRVEAAVKALLEVSWLAEQSDGALTNTFPWKSDGFVEPLVRLISVVEAASFQADGSPGVSRDKVFRELSSQPLGADFSRKGGDEARQLLEFGRRFGVIDVYPNGVDGYVIGSVPGHPLVRRVRDAVRMLKACLPQEGWTPETQLLSLIRGLDSSSDPVFGVDVHDQKSTLRALNRSGVTARNKVDGETLLRLRGTKWVAGI